MEVVQLLFTNLYFVIHRLATESSSAANGHFTSLDVCTTDKLEHKLHLIEFFPAFTCSGGIVKSMTVRVNYLTFLLTQFVVTLNKHPK